MSGRWAAEQVLVACGHPPGNPLLLLLLSSSFSVIQMSFLKLVCYLALLGNVSKRGLGRRRRQVGKEECILSLFIFLPLLWFSHAWQGLILTCSHPVHWLEFSAFGGYQPSFPKAIASTFWSTTHQRAAELCTFLQSFFLPSWICYWVVQYQPQYWETAKSSSGSMIGILGRYHLKADLGISQIVMPCRGWNLQ